jgi:hypothetical protein
MWPSVGIVVNGAQPASFVDTRRRRALYAPTSTAAFAVQDNDEAS